MGGGNRLMPRGGDRDPQSGPPPRETKRRSYRSGRERSLCPVHCAGGEGRPKHRCQSRGPWARESAGRGARPERRGDFNVWNKWERRIARPPKCQCREGRGNASSAVRPRVSPRGPLHGRVAMRRWLVRTNRNASTGEDVRVGPLTDVHPRGNALHDWRTSRVRRQKRPRKVRLDSWNLRGGGGCSMTSADGGGEA